MLHKITEESIIQSGMLGKFLPPLVKIATHAVQKYSNA
jgi:condensin complex subunit 1